MGLKLIRRRERDGATYFIVNASGKSVDGWVPLTTTARSAAVYAAMHGTSGVGRVRAAANGWAEVYLQFPAHASRIVRTYDTIALRGAAWPYMESAGAPVPVSGRWSLEFRLGRAHAAGQGRRRAARLVDRAAGERREELLRHRALYASSFARPTAPDSTVRAWRLDLGTVHESARIVLNGRELGTFIGPWFRVDVPASAFRARNVLEIEVTNLMANRIADLDRRGVAWKKFYNINFPARLQRQPRRGRVVQRGQVDAAAVGARGAGDADAAAPEVVLIDRR